MSYASASFSVVSAGPSHDGTVDYRAHVVLIGILINVVKIIRGTDGNPVLFGVPGSMRRLLELIDGARFITPIPTGLCSLDHLGGL